MIRIRASSIVLVVLSLAGCKETPVGCVFNPSIAASDLNIEVSVRDCGNGEMLIIPKHKPSSYSFSVKSENNFTVDVEGKETIQNTSAYFLVGNELSESAAGITFNSKYDLLSLNGEGDYAPHNPLKKTISTYDKSGLMINHSVTLTNSVSNLVTAGMLETPFTYLVAPSGEVGVGARWDILYSAEKNSLKREYEVTEISPLTITLSIQESFLNSNEEFLWSRSFKGKYDAASRNLKSGSSQTNIMVKKHFMKIEKVILSHYQGIEMP